MSGEGELEQLRREVQHLLDPTASRSTTTAAQSDADFRRYGRRRTLDVVVDRTRARRPSAS